MDSFDFLRLVAGDLCPCGHDASDHEEPVLPDEAMGACRVCECKGVIVLDEADE